MKAAENQFVSVGLLRLSVEAEMLSALDRRLSKDDQTRAARFRRVEDRARFLLGRALLAQMLAARWGTAPVALELALTKQGRPYLPERLGTNFSISHSGNWVGVALTEGAEVGLDIESLDRRVDLPALSERIFNPADLARFQALPAPDQVRAFFRAWTGKEALSKAKGVGLFGGVQDLSVPLYDVPAEVRDPHDKRQIWYVCPVSVEAGYMASLACSRFVDNLSRQTWQPDQLA